MSTPTEANPSLGPLLPLYNTSTGQTNVAWDADPASIATDAEGVTHGKASVTAAFTVTNPAVTEEQIRAYIAAGQGFTAFVNGSITAAQAAGISLFANDIAKTIVVYRVTSGEATAGSNCKLCTKTTDFALGAGTAIASNPNLGSANTSLITLSSSITATASGTIIDFTLLPAFIATEILENSEVIVIPAGSIMAFAAFTDCVGTTGQGFVSISWLEI